MLTTERQELCLSGYISHSVTPEEFKVQQGVSHAAGNPSSCAETPKCTWLLKDVQCDSGRRTLLPDILPRDKQKRLAGQRTLSPHFSSHFIVLDSHFVKNMQNSLKFLPQTGSANSASTTSLAERYTQGQKTKHKINCR